MIDPGNVPEIRPDEVVTRFILQSSHFRADGTVKSDAFMPPPNLRFSVNRLLLANEPETWAFGKQVSEIRQKTLYGRVDMSVEACQKQSLKVAAAPIEGNPNHADIINWPSEISRQKLIAIELSTVIGHRLKKPPP